MDCDDCSHPAHPYEKCDYVPWDGNPYGYDCGCPGDDVKARAMGAS